MLNSNESYVKLLTDWNEKKTFKNKSIVIEDDTLRDGLQSALLRIPNYFEKKELVTLAHASRIKYVMLGFPGASEDAYHECRLLVQFIRDMQWPLVPRLLGRANQSDMAAICRLQEETGVPLQADFFINICALRLKVEGWNLATITQMIHQASEQLDRHGVSYSISLEDATRSDTSIIEKMLCTIVNTKAIAIVLCDTVGACLPSGVANLLRFVKKTIAAHNSHIFQWWHGHNDRGLALANALCALDHGIDGISGTFLGIGERSGNICIEQIMLHLNQYYGSAYCLDSARQYCSLLSRYTEYTMPINQPLFGNQSFTTTAGTHIRALEKAKRFGTGAHDLLYSSVAAHDLGRQQQIMLGPMSGRSAVKSVLEQIGESYDEKKISTLFNYFKKIQKPITVQEFIDIYPSLLTERDST